MKKYEPKELVAVSRYRDYFPTLPLGLQNEIYDRMRILIEEEKEYCDKGNYKHIINYGYLPYTDFIRTKTLCKGGDECDFRFVRHDTDAGEGWERSKSI